MSFINHMQQTISRALTTLGNARLGTVSSSIPSDSTIKVLIQPENVEVGPVQYATPWIGWFSPPSPGQQCIVIFQEGSKDVPIGALMLYDNAHMPPGAVAGEAIAYHSSGSYIKLANDGSINIVTAGSANPINITATGDVDLTVGGDLNATVTGDITATTSGDASLTAASGQITLAAPIINLDGDVTITGTLTGNGGGISVTGGNIHTTGTLTADTNVVGGGISLDSHVHGGVQSGGSNTGGPV